MTIDGESRTGGNSPESPSEKPRSNRRTRLFVLLSTFALLCIALAYDYQVARASVRMAHGNVTELSVLHNAVPRHEILTNKMVSKSIGKDPSSTFQDGRYTVEVYSWPSGLPFRHYHLYTVFLPMDGKMMLTRLHKFHYETSAEVVPINDNQQIEVTAEMRALFDQAIPLENPHDVVDLIDASESGLKQDSEVNL